MVASSEALQGEDEIPSPLFSFRRSHSRIRLVSEFDYRPLRGLCGRFSDNTFEILQLYLWRVERSETKSYEVSESQNTLSFGHIVGLLLLCCLC